MEPGVLIGNENIDQLTDGLWKQVYVTKRVK